MPIGRNPVWQRDELILALEVYMKWCPNLPPNENHADIVELSQLHQLLPLIPENQRRDSFRNPAGVSMKLANFQYLDPHSGGGLDAYGKRDAAIWEEFSEEPALLRKEGCQIRQSAT